MFLGRRRIPGKITGWILIGNTRLFSHFRPVVVSCNNMQCTGAHLVPDTLYVMWHETCRITLTYTYTLIPGHHDSVYSIILYRFISDIVPFNKQLSMCLWYKEWFSNDFVTFFYLYLNMPQDYLFWQIMIYYSGLSDGIVT